MCLDFVLEHQQSFLFQVVFVVVVVVFNFKKSPGLVCCCLHPPSNGILETCVPNCIDLTGPRLLFQECQVQKEQEERQESCHHFHHCGTGQTNWCRRIFFLLRHPFVCVCHACSVSCTSVVNMHNCVLF